MEIQMEHYAFAAMILLAALVNHPQAQVAQAQCNYTIYSSSSNFSIYSIASCQRPSVTFQPGASEDRLYCNGTDFASSSSIYLLGNNKNDSLVGCGLSGSQINIYGNSQLEIISPAPDSFTPLFSGPNSSVTVGHRLTINLVEPYGTNSLMYGDRVAGFSWIFPTIGNTIWPNDTELQLGEFFPSNFTKYEYPNLLRTLPFGAYNGTASEIYYSPVNYSYGHSVGHRTFLLPQYTLFSNGTHVDYNPYQVDYSFLEYDQLDEFTLNMTQDYTLVPLYIQPIHPTFNFNIVPDNGTNYINITWLVAVPPQDASWNGTVYLYRYAPYQFRLTPLAGIGKYSVFKAMLRLPANTTPSYIDNGTPAFLLGLPQILSLGLNSSIVSAVGTIPGVGKFIQDSTTPSFSMGLGFCSTVYNDSVPQAPLFVNVSGTYHMVSRLYPLIRAGYPGTVAAPCAIGAWVKGRNITIDCRNGSINDTGVGIMLSDSRNISIDNCNIYGNGLVINNSTRVTVRNTALISNGTSQFAVSMYNSSDVSFYNTTIENHYATLFSNESGSAIAFYGLTMCNAGTSSYINSAFLGHSNVTGLVYNCTAPPAPTVQSSAAAGGSGWQPSLPGPDGALVGSVIALVAVYAYIFYRLKYKPGRRRGRRAGRTKGKRK